MSAPTPGPGTPPTADQVRVATGALRADAAIWDRQARTMADAAARARALDMNRVQAGMFQILVSAYQQACRQVVDRCTEGEQAMGAVARTLHEVADTYEREEAAAVHRLRDLY